MSYLNRRMMKLEPNDDEMDDGAAELHGDAYDGQERVSDHFDYDDVDCDEDDTAAYHHDDNDDATAANIDPSFTLPTQEFLRRCKPMPPFICAEGKDHCPKRFQKRKQIKEWLFLAAVQGCRPCVQHCIEEFGLDVDIQSDDPKFTKLAQRIGLKVVMDWAQRGVDVRTQEVVRYLKSVDSSQRVFLRKRPQHPTPNPKFKKTSRTIYALFPQPLGSTDYVPFEIDFEGGRHLCKKHKPKSKSRRHDPKYWFFNAVTDGCQRCVACCVYRHNIDKDVVSDNNQFTAQDFARYNENADMLRFLQMLHMF